MSKRRTTANGAAGAQPAADPTWDSDDPEIRALSRNTAFRELLRRSAESAEHDGTIPIEEMRAFRDLTPEDDAEGERLLAELERQTEEEEAARLAARQRSGAPTSAPASKRKAPAKAS